MLNFNFLENLKLQTSNFKLSNPFLKENTLGKSTKSIFDFILFSLKTLNFQEKLRNCYLINIQQTVFLITCLITADNPSMILDNFITC